MSAQWGKSSLILQIDQNQNIQSTSWGFSTSKQMNQPMKFDQNKSKDSFLKSKQVSTHLVYLLSDLCNFDIFKYMPQQFTITTNNSSGKFNTDLISKISKVISQYHKDNPTSLEYHLKIDDNSNAIEKIAKVYKGEIVTFFNDDITTSKIISEELNLTFVPTFMKKTIQKSEGKKLTFPNYNNQVSVNFNKDLKNYMQNIAFKKFTIHTKNNEYKCNVFGILSSTVIRDFLKTNPDSDQFIYEFDDEEGEFYSICNLFNFKNAEMSSKNVYTINEIAKDLGIECIFKSVDTFIEEVEKVSQTIDDQQNIIDTIDDLFDLLYHIKEKTVDFVVDSIIDSNWSKTDENVIELTAFILQVANNSIQSQPFLIELIEKLSNEESMKILLPFFKKRLLIYFNENMKYNSCNDNIFPFIYQMLKRGHITFDEIGEKLDSSLYKNSFFVSWFLPELSKKDNIKRNLIYPANEVSIEKLIELRDKGEIEDELTEALRKDDVDTFQKFISSGRDKILKEKVPVNMFEPFMNNDTRFLNYAAAYGSIKCFKYLLLNDEQIDSNTFKMAIIGGNNELIRIVDNNDKNISQSQIYSALRYTIQTHQNDLFDWVLEQNSSNIGRGDFATLITCSIANGNPHSLIQLIDNGFNLKKSPDDYSRFLEIASHNGFCLLTSLIYNLNNEKNSQKVLKNIKYSVYFDNISILQIFEKEFSQQDFDSALIDSIECDSMRIIKYFFEQLIPKKKYVLNSGNSRNILSKTIQIKSNHILNYLIENTKIFNHIETKILYNLLDETFSYSNFEASKKISELIYLDDPKNKFTTQFYKAAKMKLKNVIQFFIEKKYSINEEELVDNLLSFVKIDVDIFSLILDFIDPYMQKKLLRIINEAIFQTNIPLVKFLLEKDALLNNSLIEAVKTNDEKLVEMIINKNSQPSYINQRINNDTALLIAAQINNIKIFKKLISIPGIDPNIYCDNLFTPLIISISTLNVELFNLLINFYGDKIKDQKWQIDKALSILTSKNLPPSKEKINKIFKPLIEFNLIDPNFRGNSITLLHLLCDHNADEIIKKFIQYDSTDVNIYDASTGNTPLITSIINGQNEISKLFINHPRININQKNCEGDSALIFAIKSNQNEIIELILQNEKFDPKECNINLAFFMANLDISKKIISMYSVDVNFIPITNNKNKFLYYKLNNLAIIDTPLVKSISKKDYELFDLIINHPSFNKSEKQILYALYVAFRHKEIELFKKLLKLSNEIDINSHYINGNTLLITILKDHSDCKFFQFLSSILEYPTFDSKKSDLLQAFDLSLYKDSSKDDGNIIDLLYKYDCDHYHLIDAEIKEKGSSYLTSIMGNGNSFIKGAEFLINHGVDPNQPDKNGVYPLKKAINFYSDDFTLFLIKTKKIDLNQKIPDKSDKSEFTTYLHIIAGLDKNVILKEILLNKLCDINITNSLGETALMQACKSRKTNCILIFFSMDGLDFNHRNNKGEDAIEMVENLNNSSNNKDKRTEEIKDKQLYLKTLLSAIKNNNNNNQNDDLFALFGKPKNPSNRSFKNPDSTKAEFKFKKLDDSSNESNKKNPIKPKYEESTEQKTESIENKKDSDSFSNSKDGENQTKQTSDSFINLKDGENQTKQKSDSSSNSKDEGNQTKQTSDSSSNSKDELNKTKPTFGSFSNSKDELNKTKPAFGSFSNSKDGSNQTKSTFGSFINSKDESNKTKQTSDSSSNSKDGSNQTKQTFGSFSNSKDELNKTKQTFGSFINSKDEGNQTKPTFGSFSNSNPNEKIIPAEANSFSISSSNSTKSSPSATKSENKVSHKFDTYNESFSEKPDETFQNLLKKLDQKTETTTTTINDNLLRKRNQNQFKFEKSFNEENSDFHSSFLKRKVTKTSKYLFDEEEEENNFYYQRNFQNQENLFLLQQQQQQWLQMIQVNNAYQAQMHMQIMDQTRMNQKKLKKKNKRSKK